MDLTTLLASGGLKSVNTGYVASVTPTAGSGEDTSYYDVTVPTVDVSKAIPTVVGGLGVAYNSVSHSLAGSPWAKTFAEGAFPVGSASYNITCRMLNATTLRVSCPVSSSGGSVTFAAMSFRWTVVEGK